MPASPKRASEFLDYFAAAARRTLGGPDADQVHILRVASRKFTQALTVLDAESEDVEKIRRRLKRIMRFAGQVRDYDITIKLAGRVQGSKTFLARLHRRRAAAERVLLAELQLWLDANTPRRWRERLAEAAPGTTASKVLSSAVKRLFKRGAAAEDSDKKLHPLRIAAKKLRYTLDLLDHSDPARVEQVKELQRRLGDINDYETARRIASAESAGKRVDSRLREKHDKKVRAFRRFWESRFSGKKHKREWQNVTLRATPVRSRRRPRVGTT